MAKYFIDVVQDSPRTARGTAYRLLRRKTLSETKAKHDKYYTDFAPTYGMVRKRFTEFRCGRTSTETTLSSSRPNEITTPEMINKVYDIILNDPKVKVHEIAEIASISTERLVNVFYHNRPKTHLCDHFAEKFGPF